MDTEVRAVTRALAPALRMLGKYKEPNSRLVKITAGGVFEPVTVSFMDQGIYMSNVIPVENVPPGDLVVDISVLSDLISKKDTLPKFVKIPPKVLQRTAREEKQNLKTDPDKKASINKLRLYGEDVKVDHLELRWSNPTSKATIPLGDLDVGMPSTGSHVSSFAVQGRVFKFFVQAALRLLAPDNGAYELRQMIRFNLTPPNLTIEATNGIAAIHSEIEISYTNPSPAEWILSPTELHRCIDLVEDGDLEITVYEYYVQMKQNNLVIYLPRASSFTFPDFVAAKLLTHDTDQTFEIQSHAFIQALRRCELLGDYSSPTRYSFSGNVMTLATFQGEEGMTTETISVTTEHVLTESQVFSAVLLLNLVKSFHGKYTMWVSRDKTWVQPDPKTIIVISHMRL
jgi:hypothetical protein